MGKFRSDLEKARLLTKMKSHKGTTSSGSLIVIQSRCSECEYNEPGYDIDEYCGQCDGQSMFRRKGGDDEEEVQEETAYDRALELLPELTSEEKKSLLQRLQEELEDEG